jgi:hypothetical protein
MIRSAASKVMWVGRATVFLMGLALMLALVLGVASKALGANLDNFIIGNGLSDTVNNIATLPTRLTMQGVDPGPALQVTQQGTNAGVSGIGVTVPSGKAPITVSTGAGKATNLNADKLDGKNATAFVPTKTYTETFSVTTNGNGSITGQGRPCDDLGTTQADLLLSGGAKLNNISTQTTVQSYPLDNHTWFAQIKDNTASSTGAGFDIIILCADLGTPHTP